MLSTLRRSLTRSLRPASALSVLLLASCASMELSETGFLGSDYSTLQPAPSRQVWGIPDEIQLDVRPALDQRVQSGQIQAVIVDPVVYRPIESARYRPDAETATRLEGYATRKFRNALGEHFEVVDEPREGAVRVRLALTDVMCSNVWINTVLTILLVPVDMGGVSGELEVVDAMTGERLYAMRATREGNFFLIFEAFNHHGHIRHGVKKWAALTSRMLRGH